MLMAEQEPYSESFVKVLSSSVNISAVFENTVFFVFCGVGFNCTVAEKNYISSSVSVRPITSTIICTAKLNPSAKA